MKVLDVSAVGFTLRVLQYGGRPPSSPGILTSSKSSLGRKLREEQIWDTPWRMEGNGEDM